MNGLEIKRKMKGFMYEKIMVYIGFYVNIF